MESDIDNLSDKEEGEKGEKVYKNKNKVDSSKIENKRKQKEAKKNKKINSLKGMLEPST